MCTPLAAGQESSPLDRASACDTCILQKTRCGSLMHGIFCGMLSSSGCIRSRRWMRGGRGGDGERQAETLMKNLSNQGQKADRPETHELRVAESLVLSLVHRMRQLLCVARDLLFPFTKNQRQAVPCEEALCRTQTNTYFTLLTFLQTHLRSSQEPPHARSFLIYSTPPSSSPPSPSISATSRSLTRRRRYHASHPRFDIQRALGAAQPHPAGHILAAACTRQANQSLRRSIPRKEGYTATSTYCIPQLNGC